MSKIFFEKTGLSAGPPPMLFDIGGPCRNVVQHWVPIGVPSEAKANSLRVLYLLPHASANPTEKQNQNNGNRICEPAGLARKAADYAELHETRSTVCVFFGQRRS